MNYIASLINHKEVRAKTQSVLSGEQPDITNIKWSQKLVKLPLTQ